MVVEFLSYVILEILVCIFIWLKKKKRERKRKKRKKKDLKDCMKYVVL